MKDEYGKEINIKITKVSGEKVNIGISNDVKPIEIKKMPAESECFNIGVGKEIPSFEVKNILYDEEKEDILSPKNHVINELVKNYIEKEKKEIITIYKEILAKLEESGSTEYRFSNSSMAKIVRQLLIGAGFDESSVKISNKACTIISIDINKEYQEAIEKIDLYIEIAKDLGLTLK